MTIVDANGHEVSHERCDCGRHRQSVDAVCCRPCGSGKHTSACNIRQEAFPDTRRGVTITEGLVSRISNHEMPNGGFRRRYSNIEF
jgi:hypothetical protein